MSPICDMKLWLWFILLFSLSKLSKECIQMCTDTYIFVLFVNNKYLTFFLFFFCNGWSYSINFITILTISVYNIVKFRMLSSVFFFCCILTEEFYGEWLKTDALSFILTVSSCHSNKHKTSRADSLSELRRHHPQNGLWSCQCGPIS